MELTARIIESYEQLVESLTNAYELGKNHKAKHAALSYIALNKLLPDYEVRILVYRLKSEKPTQSLEKIAYNIAYKSTPLFPKKK